MKIKHFLAMVASFFLSACGTTTPTPSENDNDDISKAEIEENEILPITPIPENEIEYAVSGENDIPTPLATNETESDIPDENSNDENKISSFSTKVYTKTSDRVKNLRIVCDKLTGTVLQPGQEFSYNNTCGPYDKENGFGKATVFVNGEEVQEYGGGVCQLSSTLYNAVKDVGCEILERHNHSKEVYYVPKNEDATVSYGVLDFRFKNTNSYPIEIHAFSDKNEVTVSIYKI